ncbi:hypothetical protein U5N28_12035 [Lysinibacillus telephonicus]|uniref:hypothetical protein n=1 Tax=Lysinibacillus telephonicus TaxID=1714840 RepID=UPI00397A9E49
MNQKQVALSLNIHKSKVGRYTKAISIYHPNFIQRTGKCTLYDTKAFRAIKYMTELVERGLLIEEAVKPVLRDIYDIVVENQESIKCQNCTKLENQLASYITLMQQQQDLINILNDRLAAK